MGHRRKWIYIFLCYIKKNNSDSHKVTFKLEEAGIFLADEWPREIYMLEATTDKQNLYVYNLYILYQAFYFREEM